MPNLAVRTKNLPASPIRKLAPYAEQARQAGRTIYQLNIGQPDLITPQVFWDAINQADLRTLAYAPSQGFASYREKLARYYDHYGANIQGEDIIVTAGGSEALMFAFLACFDPGDELIVPEPFYANYLGFARSMGQELVPLSTHVEEDFALPPVERFKEVVTERTKGILLCNPANPTGKLYQQEALQKLEQIVREHDLFLIADEVYKEFVYDGHAFTSTLSFPDLQQHVVAIDSASKKWSACGSRLGNLVTKNREILDAALKLAQARLSPPTMGQIGAEALLDLPQSYYDEIRQAFTQRRDLVVDTLNDIPGVYCPRSSGAFYVMPKLPVDDTERFCQWMLEHYHDGGYTVMLAPGKGFYVTPGRGYQEVRLAYVLAEEHLTHALKVLRGALEQYPGRVEVDEAASLRAQS